MAAKANLKEMKGFIENYKSFSRSHEKQKFDHFKQQVGPLIQGYKSLKDEIKLRNRKEARNYNIFDILNVRFGETTTHTPFLKNLLDPNGAHGQRDLFLEHFIHKFIPPDKKGNFELDEDRNYNVVEEKSMSRGRIDIYIDSFDAKNRFAIIIENKIYAGDQFEQLKRYYEFLRDGIGYDDKQIMIFYLTPTGVLPEEKSLDEELREELSNNQVFKTISYKKDVKDWLEECIQKVEAPKVKMLANQYLRTVKKL